MNRYLLVTSFPDSYPRSKRPVGADEEYSSPYHLCVKTGELDGDTILLVANPELELQDLSDRLVGTWDLKGIAIGSIDQELYQQFRPLGNYASQSIYDENGDVIGQTQGGNATTDLGYHSVAGDVPRQLGSSNALYPDDNQPFPISFRHKYFSGHADPSHDGWGWRAEMDAEFIPITRDPEGYFVEIYNKAECRVEDAWYQAGGFTQIESEWQLDEEGNPLTVWGCEYDQAYLGYPEKQDIHHGICKGSIHNQHGYETLLVTEEADHYLFWEGTQGGGDTGGPVPEWVQPVGAHDAYKLDDHVMHNDIEWVSVHDGDNVWEPGVYGWEQV